jgi:hypothetical protein
MWFPCHYFCAGLMLIGQFHRRCLAVNHGLFGPLKEALRGRRLTADQQVKEAVHAWLVAQPKTFFSFFSEGIRKLVQRWTKCVEQQGDYVEK